MCRVNINADGGSNGVEDARGVEDLSEEIEGDRSKESREDCK